MPIRQITPRQAHELMQGPTAHVYLDVRSTQEFAAGHAPGALNVPIAHLGAMGMEANPDFLDVVQATVPKETALLIGCKMGGRSSRACEILERAGYTNLHNVDGGFSGRGDGGDESVRKGWSGSGLPVSAKPAPGASYDDLRARAR